VNGAVARNSQHKVAFLLLPEFMQFGLAAAIEPLFIANWLAGDALFAWRVVSTDGKPVRASNGALSPVDGDLSQAEDRDSVFVLASFEPSQAARNPQVIRWLKRMARKGTELGGIENGSQALAEAGLLDRHTVAIHWDNLAGFQELYAKVTAVAQLYAFSGNRISCAGGSAILDMMVAWISRHTDAELASEVAKHLLLNRVRAPHSEQRASESESAAHADPVVGRAQSLMRASMDDPLTCREIARRLGFSLRQIERRFKRDLGRSVHREYVLLRIEKAHQYLQQTELSVTEVAVSCGFGSAEYFSRLYRRTFGIQPRADRLQSTGAPVFRRHDRSRREPKA
jgi:AraC family transcriptional regulator, carnitine catabolism transcriptional activator